jgi:hypothetical protein
VTPNALIASSNQGVFMWVGLRRADRDIDQDVDERINAGVMPGH